MEEVKGVIHLDPSDSGHRSFIEWFCREISESDLKGMFKTPVKYGIRLDRVTLPLSKDQKRAVQLEQERWERTAIHHGKFETICASLWSLFEDVDLFPLLLNEELKPVLIRALEWGYRDTMHKSYIAKIRILDPKHYLVVNEITRSNDTVKNISKTLQSRQPVEPPKFTAKIVEEAIEVTGKGVALTQYFNTDPQAVVRSASHYGFKKLDKRENETYRLSNPDDDTYVDFYSDGKFQSCDFDIQVNTAELAQGMVNTLKAIVKIYADLARKVGVEQALNNEELNICTTHSYENKADEDAAIKVVEMFNKLVAVELQDPQFDIIRPMLKVNDKRIMPTKGKEEADAPEKLDMSKTLRT